MTFVRPIAARPRFAQPQRPGDTLARVRPTYTHFRILFDALDAYFVAEVLTARVMPGDRRHQPADEWPELSIPEARAALIELVSEGCVMLVSTQRHESISPEDARQVLAQAEPWTSFQHGDRHNYELVVTDRGMDLYAELVRHHWPEGLT